MLEKNFDPAAIEQTRYASWEEQGCFAANPESNKKPHVLMMPPPNVTGSLHIGHALTMTLQDVLTRYKRMRGFDALWQPGTDHAGIATQLIVERQLNTAGDSRHNYSRDEFIAKVWEWKEQSGGAIMKQLRRLGASADFARERFTMDEGLSKAVRKVFVQLYNEKLIYRAKRLVNWDPKMQTALSDLEVFQKEVKGNLWHIDYPIEGHTAEYITIATTRPETMLGDTAIIVHPDDERYKHLVGKFAVLPIVGRLLPILADDSVEPEYGTGAMKVTPAHDFKDFETGKRHNLEVIGILDKQGRINENAPAEYQGLDRFDARKKILAELDAQELLRHTQPVSHSVPHDEKTKSVILEPLLTDQWYCDAATLAKPALEAVETGKTKFVPQQWENTYYAWMRNIQPWCISRQLWWGHQIPAWYDEDGTVYVAETEEDARQQAGPKARLTRDPDVLDTWFSSALWPFSTLGWPDETIDLKKYYPGDVLITGFDIIFFWVARMMMMGIHFMGDVPFKHVYIHGLVRDGQGQKMSKTKGNVVDPIDVVDEYGADGLRFAMCALTQQGRDIKLSGDRVESYRNFVTKLWNASRFAQMQGASIPDESFDPAALKHTLNQWIVTALSRAITDAENALDMYRFSDGAMALYHFVWGTLCDWYIEFTKPILGDKDHPAYAETLATTGWVLGRVYTLLSPFMPFVTEELRQSLSAKAPETPLMLESWPVLDKALIKTDAEAQIGFLIALISDIRSIRSDMNVPASSKVNLVIRGADAATKTFIGEYAELVQRMARVDAIDYTDNFPKGTVQSVCGPVTIGLPIAELIDLDKERDRLQKEIKRLQGDIAKIDEKLGNAEFVSNAPPDIIEEQKSRKSDWSATLEKLAHALEQLKAA